MSRIAALYRLGLDWPDVLAMRSTVLEAIRRANRELVEGWAL